MNRRGSSTPTLVVPTCPAVATLFGAKPSPAQSGCASGGVELARNSYLRTRKRNRGSGNLFRNLLDVRGFLERYAAHRFLRLTGTALCRIVNSMKNMKKTTTAVRCESGEATGEGCAGLACETIEYMPEYLRASHRAAGNDGCWPSNGSLRLRVCAECGEALTADDSQK